jgi:hypothetical protein
LAQRDSSVGQSTAQSSLSLLLTPRFSALFKAHPGGNRFSGFLSVENC